MARNAMTIRGMGESTCWMIIKQAMGIPDAKMKSDFMQNRVALLLFARASLPERLCVTAAVRQMGGSTIYQGAEAFNWRDDTSSFQKDLFPILGYFLDCLYVYGLNTLDEKYEQVPADFPLINAGCNLAHPAHALADIACMLRVLKKESIEDIPTAWIGCANGALRSLMETSVWCPFRMTIALPPEEDAEPLKQRARELRTRLTFVETPEEAIRHARFVYAGRKPKDETATDWAITPELMARADPEARLLLSATPVRAIHVSPGVLDSKNSLLVRQAQYRLCVHKRILHWVFETEQL